MSPPTCCQRLKIAVQTWWFHLCLSRYVTSMLAIVNCGLGILHLPRKNWGVSVLTRAGYVLFTLAELRICHSSLYDLGEAMIHGMSAHTGGDSFTPVFFLVIDTAILGTDFFLLVDHAPYLAWTAKQWQDTRYQSIRIISPEKMAAGFPWLYTSMILLLFAIMYASGVCCYMLRRIWKARKATKRLTRRFRSHQGQVDGGETHRLLDMDCEWLEMETSESLSRRHIGIDTNIQP